MATSAERAAKWKQLRIDSKLCLGCPNTVTNFRRCLSCRIKKAEYIRNLPYKEKKREIDKRRLQKRLDNSLCVSCGVPSTTYRCEKCNKRHRRYGRQSYSNRRDLVRVRGAVSRTLSRLHSDTDKLLLHVRNFIAVGVAINENKKGDTARVAPSQGQCQ